MSHEHERRLATAGGRAARHRELTAGFRRSLGLTALGTVLPGAGLTLTTRKALGWFILGVFTSSVIGIVALVLTRGTMRTALDLVSRPALVQALGVLFVVAGVIWCGSIIVTALVTRPRRLDRARNRVLTGFTVVMVVLVAGVSFKAAEYATITKETVTRVFGPSGTLRPGQGAKLVEGEDPWAQTPRVNILLLGSDAGVGREGTRTDSMVVASIDTHTGDTVLISLPRNLEDVPIPAESPLRRLYPSGVYGEPTCYRALQDAADRCMLNAIWMEVDQFRADHPEAWAGQTAPGREEVAGVISEALGLTIDHLVVIDLKGFEQLVDAMGGVEMNVKLSGYGTQLPIAGKVNAYGQIVGVKGYFEPGLQHLDGYHALWYARTRAADDDFHRQQRQRCVIKAVVKQVNPTSMLTQYVDIARIAQDNLYTDIQAETLPAYVELVQRVQRAKITSVALSPTQGVYPGNPDYDLIHSLVDEAINPPAPTTPTTPAIPRTGSSDGTSTSSTPTGEPTTPSEAPTATQTPTGSATPPIEVDECA